MDSANVFVGTEAGEFVLLFSQSQLNRTRAAVNRSNDGSGFFGNGTKLFRRNRRANIHVAVFAELTRYTVAHVSAYDVKRKRTSVR